MPTREPIWIHLSEYLYEVHRYYYSKTYHILIFTSITKFTNFFV